MRISTVEDRVFLYLVHVMNRVKHGLQKLLLAPALSQRLIVQETGVFFLHFF